MHDLPFLTTKSPMKCPCFFVVKSMKPRHGTSFETSLFCPGVRDDFVHQHRLRWQLQKRPRTRTGEDKTWEDLLSISSIASFFLQKKW